MITVDSRKRDPKSEMVVKHESVNGVPINYKPVRKISPDISRLSPLARFIVENLDGTYIGGFLHRKNNVRVEGPEGSQREIDIKTHGLEHADAMAKMYNLNPLERATIKGYLFPVFEPHDDETEYFNTVARAITKTAGIGGRVIIYNKVFNIE